MAILVIFMTSAALAQSRHGGVSVRMSQMSTYSASGTHECNSETDRGHTCVATGLAYSNCIEAANSLRLQDCCPTTQVCQREQDTGATTCRRGGKSVGFTLNYCISSGRF
jgi:hypothetical protein